jgi:hypothetical protein
MKSKSGILIAVLFLLTAAGALDAQQPPPPSTLPPRIATGGSSADSASQPPVYYRLDFVIREMDREKPVDTRNYSLWVQSGVYENMTVGSEVPYPGSAYSTGGGTTKSIQYRSIGVSIGCTLKEGNDSPQLDLKLNISDALPPEKDSDTPAFRKITLDSRALLTLGKPTTVSIVEDPGSRHRYQVDVTATKLK